VFITAALLAGRRREGNRRDVRGSLLILFPGRSIARQRRHPDRVVFASAWGRYDGVDDINKRLVVMAEAPGSVWVDVTWSYGGQPRERF
jgi:hypothetical protein